MCVSDIKVEPFLDGVVVLISRSIALLVIIRINILTVPRESWVVRVHFILIYSQI